MSNNDMINKLSEELARIRAEYKTVVSELENLASRAHFVCHRFECDDPEGAMSQVPALRAMVRGACILLDEIEKN